MADNPTLTSAITAALATAQYEQLDDGSFSGRIPNYPGVLAFAPTLAACRDELQSTLKDWLLLGLKLNHPIPAEGPQTIDALNQEVAAYYSSLSPSEQAELDECANFATHEFTHRDS